MVKAIMDWLNTNSGALQVILKVISLLLPASLIAGITKGIQSRKKKIRLVFNPFEKAIPGMPFHYVSFEAYAHSKEPIQLEYLGPALMRKGYYEKIPIKGLDKDGRLSAGKPLKKYCFSNDLLAQLTRYSLFTEVYIYAKTFDGKEYAKPCGKVMELYEKLK